ncbi:MAG: CHASE4 domain-containing protein [Acidobacteriota bacterium]
MTLRNKHLLLLGGLLAAWLGAAYFAASSAFESLASRSEEEGLKKDVRRVQGAWRAELAQLEAIAKDWAQWDDTCSFVETGDPAYVKSNLVDSTFRDLGLDVMVIANARGEVAWGRGFDREPGQMADLPAGLAAHLGPSSTLVRHPHTECGHAGLLALPEDELLVVSWPIVTSEGEGPVRGSVIVGRRMNDAAWRRISELTQVSLTVRRLGAANLPADFARAAASLSGREKTIVQSLGDGWIASYSLLADVYGKPVLLLRVDAPTEIAAWGKTSLREVMGLLVVAALVLAMIGFVVLERTVLTRLAGLAGAVGNIRASGDPAARLPVRGRDELAGLAATINQALDSLGVAQREKGESEGRFRAVVEQAWETIFLFDPVSGRLIEANQAFERLLGYALPEVSELSIADLFAHDRASIDEDFAGVLSRRRCAIGERTLRQKGGAEITVELTASLVSHRGREVICGIARDTTERSRLEARLRQSQQLEAVGRLSGGVAHDFNNLLQAVISGIESLRKRGAGTSASSEILAALEGQVARGAALTRQLLLIARQETFRPEPLDLNQVASEAAAFLRRVVRENIHLRLDLASEALPVEGDRSHLQQALVNLVVHLAQGLSGGGELGIATGASSDEDVWVEVRDCSPAPAASGPASPFEPFLSIRPGDPGAGLDLAVVQGIITEHHGRVEPARGERGSLRVTLPRRAAGAAPMHEARAMTGEAPPSRGERVLLVEDEEAARAGLAEMLGILGYRVEAYGSAEDALAASADPFELLLTDFMLPGMSGGELASRLTQRWPQLKVVVMSGYAAEEAVRRSADLGALRFLQKPFGMEALAQELRAALGDVTS